MPRITGPDWKELTLHALEKLKNECPFLNADIYKVGRAWQLVLDHINCVLKTDDCGRPTLTGTSNQQLNSHLIDSIYVLYCPACVPKNEHLLLRAITCKSKSFHNPIPNTKNKPASKQRIWNLKKTDATNILPTKQSDHPTGYSSQ